MGGFQHLHEEGVDGRVPDEFEEEEVFQALEADGAQGRQAEKQLGEPAGGPREAEPAVLPACPLAPGSLLRPGPSPKAIAAGPSLHGAREGGWAAQAAETAGWGLGAGACGVTPKAGPRSRDLG